MHRGRKFDFEVVSLEQPGRSSGDGGAGAGGGPARVVEREMIRHPGAVCILPILSPGEAGWSGTEAGVVLIRNHRFTVGRVLWEIPAGGLEPEESPSACARRELIEETGYEASEVKRLGSFLTTPGVTDEQMHGYAATGLRHVGQALEEDEHITVAVRSVSDVLGMVRSGEIEDAKSMLTVLLALEAGVLRAGEGS